MSIRHAMEESAMKIWTFINYVEVYPTKTDPTDKLLHTHPTQTPCPSSFEDEPFLVNTDQTTMIYGGCKKAM